MLEKMKELIADQLSVDADSITEEASVMLSASTLNLLQIS